MRNPIRLSVVVPMYNEEESIKKSLMLITSALDSFVDEYEIIIVDDASTDASLSIVEECVRTNGKINIVRHPNNRTLGGALRSGFAAAQYDLILYTDADMPFDLMETKKALRILFERQADMVSAFRFDRGGEGFKRFIYSYVYNFIIRMLFGLCVNDVNFCFKLFKRNVLQSFTLRSEGSFIDAELLIQCMRHQKKIVQFGTDYFPRRKGISRLCRLPMIITILREMIAFKFTAGNVTQ